MLQELRASLVVLIFFTLITGIGYPLLMTRAGQALFPHQANGSLVEKDGKIIGSELIGQTFTVDKYFHARPSAAGNGYDAGNSSGSNLAPTSPDLLKTIGDRVSDLRKNGDVRAIPVDMVTASGSGLDPEISLASAQYQASRVAAARNMSVPLVEKLITQNTISRSFGVLGENRINVLAINRALDLLSASSP